MLNSFSIGSLRGKPIVAMVLSAACWGLGTVMSKGLLENLPPLTLLVVQLTASITFLWTVALIRRKQRDAALPNQSRLLPLWKMLRLGFPGLLEPGFAYIFGLLGLAMTTASNASLIGTIEPIIIVGLAWLLLGEHIGLSLLALSAVALAGVILTVGFDPNLSGSSLIGDLLIVAGTLCAALYVVLSRRGVAKLNPLPLAAIQQSVGLAWAILVWLLVLEHGEAAKLAGVSPDSWVWAIASGVVQYALAFWLYLIALKGIPASIAAQFLSLIPVFGVCGAYLFLGERLTIMQGFGMVLIIAAVSGISRLEGDRDGV